jgi:hypothetical protein
LRHLDLDITLSLNHPDSDSPLENLAYMANFIQLEITLHKALFLLYLSLIVVKCMGRLVNLS